jgi:tRNA(Ile)-lysidine synthase
VTDLLAHVENSIRQRKLLPPDRRVLVAVSGGLDSMVLLHLLHHQAAANRWRLGVAHFNHQLRGRASNADEYFVRATAGALGLPCFAGKGSVQPHAQRTGQSIEMAARELRHAYLAQAARRFSARTLALAHHADDQVELFFLRLLRGAGGEGLAGMRWLSPSPADDRLHLIRPLLDVPRADLAEFAREHGIRFREDRSNRSLAHERNRIRHDLLPELESRARPGFRKAIWRAMEIIGAEAEFVAESARRWLRGPPRPPFDSLPIALQRRCLQLQLQRRRLAAEFSIAEWLRLRPGQPICVDREVSVCRDESGMVQIWKRATHGFDPSELCVPLTEPAGEVVFGRLRCSWRLTAARVLRQPSRQRQREQLDADQVGSGIVLRHWRPGDRFQPIGMSAAVKLQDWFTNLKIPAARRRELVLATTADGEIFWIEGLRISERFKLTQRTRRRLEWRWKPA